MISSGVPTRSAKLLFCRVVLLLAAGVCTNLYGGQPSIRLSTNLLDFSTVQVGAHSDLTLTIFNDGASSLGVTGLTGLPAQGFSLVSPPTTPFQVNPSSSVDVTVRFTPSGSGPFESSLGITSNDQLNPNLSVTLKGTGAPAQPDIALSTSGISFGAVALGDSANQPLTLFNQGATTLTVSALTDLPSDGFSIVSPPSGSFEIAAGSFRALTMHFAPPTSGAHQAIMHILSDDPDQGDISILLTGSGSANPSCFINQIETSVYGLDMAGILSNAKAKHLSTGETKLSAKLTINQLRMPDIITSPTVGVPALTVSVYLIDGTDVCALSQLPAALISLETKAGKPGKPGKPAKAVKAKISLTTAADAAGKSLLVVLDPDNHVLETDKANNFLVSVALP